MMATANVGTLLGGVKERLGAIAVAFLSRDGSVLYADLPGGAFAETFAVLCATTFAAAATAQRELERAPPERAVLEGGDSVTVLVGGGSQTLLVAVVDRPADVPRIFEELGKLADLLTRR